MIITLNITHFPDNSYLFSLLFSTYTNQPIIKSRGMLPLLSYPKHLPSKPLFHSPHPSRQHHAGRRSHQRGQQRPRQGIAGLRHLRHQKIHAHRIKYCLPWHVNKRKLFFFLETIRLFSNNLFYQNLYG